MLLNMVGFWLVLFWVMTPDYLNLPPTLLIFKVFLDFSSILT